MRNLPIDEASKISQKTQGPSLLCINDCHLTFTRVFTTINIQQNLIDFAFIFKEAKSKLF